MRSHLPAAASVLLLALAVPSAFAAPGNLSFASPDAVTLTEDPALTPEAQITVVRTDGTDGAVTAELAAIPLAGLESADYPPIRYRMNAASPWTVLPWRSVIPLSFPDGTASVTFEVQAIDNDAWEGLRATNGLGVNCTLTLQNISAPAAAGSLLTKRIQLEGNDPPPVMTITPLVAAEGNGVLAKTRYLQVNLDRAIARRSINYTIALVGGGTATSGQDFDVGGLPVPTTLPAYTKQFTVPVTFYPDADTEPDETFTVSIGLTAFPIGPGSDSLILTAQDVVTIQNDEFPPVTIGNASILEGGTGDTSLLVFPVTLAAPLAQAVSFQWATQTGSGAGTATPGADYTAASGTVTIPAGSTSSSIAVTVNGDAAVEPDESVLLALSAPSGISLSENSPAGTIVDDDFSRILVGNASAAEGNAIVTPLVFPVTLTIPQAAPVSFNWSSHAGTATAGSDFHQTSGTLTIPAGETTGAITLQIICDTAIEPDETLTLQFSNSSGPPLPASPATGTILNDDLPALSISHIFMATVETDTNVSNTTFNLMLSGFPVGQPSVEYTVDGPAGSLTPMSGVITFFNGVPMISGPLFTVIGDDIAEADATYRIRFFNPIGLSLANGSEFPLLTIVDDDRPAVTVTGGSVVEGHAGTVNLPFTIAIDTAPATDLTFHYLAAGGGANPDSDYLTANGTATIPAGATSVILNVIVTGDTEIEPDETVNLMLSAFSQPVEQGLTTSGIIRTDDFPPAATPLATLVTEAVGTHTVQAWFEVNIPAPLTMPFTCRVSTRNDTAVAGTDFNALAPTDITFAPGETQKWVAITVTATRNAEPREQFFLDVESLDSLEIKSAACIIEPLAITDFWRPAANIFAVRFPTGLGQRYIIDEAESLAGPWSPASAILTGTGAPVTQLMFSLSDGGFFRVRTAPPLPPGSPAAGS